MVAPRRGAHAEESAEVEVLYANLEKLKSLTKKIQGSLNRLETSGKNVEEAIAPIYSSTQRLQITNKNIDNVIETIDRLRKPVEQRDGEDLIIRQDPRAVGIPDYIASIDRATRTLAGLQSSKLAANKQAMSDMAALVRFGARQLEDVFKGILMEESVKIEPMQYIAKGGFVDRVDFADSRGLGKPFPRISESNDGILRQIHAHVAASVAQTSSGAAEAPTIKVYADIRGDYITSTSRTLAMAAVNTGRKMNADQLYQPGTNTLPMYADGLRQMAEAEYESVTAIYRREEWDRVLSGTMEAPLKDFGKTLRDLNLQIQGSLMTDCFLAYEVIGTVQKLALDLERIADVRRPIMDALRPIRDTAKASMPKLLSNIRESAQGLVGLPQDGAAIPLTSEVMTRLQIMTRILEPVSSVLMDLGDGGWNRQVQALDVRPNGAQLFSNYSQDTIDTLLQALDARARVLIKTTPVQGVFMVNNIAIIERMVQDSELAPLIGAMTARLLDNWNKKCGRRYMDSWRDVCAHLFDQQNTKAMRQSGSNNASTDSAAVVRSLASKERDAIKEKFRQFNATFDELVAKHKSYAFEREVKVQLAKDIAALVEPLYRRFWDRYHEIDKGKGKYVKYDKAQMSSILASLGS